MKYEAEIRVFKSKFGDLENVRKTLGFSRRKMCQLLLVDPSAWTRWHSPGSAPPPYVYRALEWFLILEGKSELHPRVADLYLKGTPTNATADTAQLKLQLADLHARLEYVKRYLWIGPVVSALTVAAAAAGIWALR